MDKTLDTKNWYGEVFTPDILINELLDALPDRVWTNPNLRWLDPCAGTGQFFEAVLTRLMKTLAKMIPNERSRKHHIITRMLYMYELNPRNVAELRRRFIKCDQRVKIFGDNLRTSNTFCNIVSKNFLETTSPLRYDVIVANPPFQSPKSATYEGSVGNRTLWDKFVVHALRHCQTKGIIAFITPSNWRRPEHPLYPILTQSNTLHYLHIYGKQDGKTLFGVQSRFDLYVVSTETKISEKRSLPIIIDEMGHKHLNINVASWPFLPNFAYRLVRKYMTPSPTMPVIYHSSLYDARKLSRHKTKKYRFPVIHTLTREGPGIWYAQEKIGHFGHPKVILNVNEKQYPINDYKGEYGMSQLSFGIPIQTKKEGEDIIARILSDEFQTILRATKWSAFQTDYRMFKYIRFI